MRDADPYSIEDRLRALRRPALGLEDEALRVQLLRDIAGVEATPVSVGRFRIVSCVGRGAHGVVYEAEDPELGRRVALKVLRQVGSGVRFAEEARALARVEHPAVVTVHEVGVASGDAYLAMAFVEGETLEAWLAAERRSPDAVLLALRQAGEGLAAVHEAGLVHGDFKPTNVMVGSDGRVRVTDFGLAVDAAEAIPRMQPGRLRGTPAYLAPERYGAGPTVHSDVYAFCLTAWHALTGVFPFEGESLEAAKLAGPRRWPSAARGVPVGVIRALRRGLVGDPVGRWPTMNGPLSALRAADPANRQHRRAVVRNGILSLLLGGAVAGLVATRHAPEADALAVCAEREGTASDFWNEETRERVVVGLRAAADGDDATAERTLPWLDRYAESWGEQAVRVCRLEAADPAWTDAIAAQAQWCLERRRVDLAVLADELGQADRATLDQAVGLASSLPPISPCGEPATLARQPPPPLEAKRVEVLDAVRGLRRAETLLVLGDYPEGLTLVGQTDARAEAAGAPGVVAEAHNLEAALLLASGRYADAEARARDVYWEALRRQQWALAVDAAGTLTTVVGYRLHRTDEGLLWGEHAAAAIEQAGDPLGVREIRRLNAVGTVHYGATRYAEAAQSFIQAIQLAEKAFGPDHPKLTGALSNLGVMQDLLGDLGAAEKTHRRALELRRTLYGPNHPSVAESLHNLGGLLATGGDYAQAQPLLEQALELRERVLAPDHVLTGSTAAALADLHVRMGDHAAAVRLARRAVEIYEAVHGPDHPQLAAAVGVLGNVHLIGDDCEEAKTLFRRSLAIRLRAFGAGHPKTATSLLQLSQATGECGDREGAVELGVRALEVEVEALGDGHPELAVALINIAHQRLQTEAWDAASRTYARALNLASVTEQPAALMGRGVALLELGQPYAAIEHLEASLGLRLAQAGSAGDIAETQAALDRARWAARAARAWPGGTTPRAPGSRG